MITDHIPQFLSAYLVYLVAVISPGPANMAIISTAIAKGRRAGLLMALGIFGGSFTWAMAASFGLAALLRHYGEALVILKIVGGLYLFYLAMKAGLSACKTSAHPEEALGVVRQERARITFLRGYLIHLTNPKAIFGWVAIISLGLPADASAGSVMLVVGGCLSTGLTVFCGYALVFSTRRAVNAYQASRRAVDGVLALLFGAAGIKMLTSSL